VTTCPERPPTEFDDALIQGLRQQRLLTDLGDTGDCNVFRDPNCVSVFETFDDESRPDAVCGVHYTDNSCQEYHLKSYMSREAAEMAGAFVTHENV